MRRFLSLVAGLCTLAALPSAAPAADKYGIDTVHSAVVYRVKHLNVGYAYGRFNDLGGSVDLDEQNPGACAFHLQIKADSIDTANSKRDGHLKGPDFLNVKEFPTISFKSTQVKLAKEKVYEVTGDLTLHGVTKSITVMVQHVGAGKDPFSGGQRTGFESNFRIRRSEFAMTGLQGPVGDEVDLLVSFEAVKP